MKNFSIEFQLYEDREKIYSGCLPLYEKESRFFFDFPTNLQCPRVIASMNNQQFEIDFMYSKGMFVGSEIIEECLIAFYISRVKNKKNRLSIVASKYSEVC